MKTIQPVAKALTLGSTNTNGKGATEVGLDELLNLDQGRMSRRVFHDSDIYQLELERIFARCWLFVAHESQLKKPGDYVSAYMGQDNVLVVRQRDGSIKVFFKYLPASRKQSLFFPMWEIPDSLFVITTVGLFGIDGRLKGMHASEAFDASNFDLSGFGLHEVPKVDSYRGLIFATMDSEAPSLAEYLGDMRYYLDAVFAMDGEGTEFVGGVSSQLFVVIGNTLLKNFVGDALHAGWTHDSGAKAMVGASVGELHKDIESSYQVNFNGHGWEFNQDIVGNCASLGDKELVKYLYALQPKVAERLGDLRSRMIGSISSCTLFPNTSFLAGQNTFRTWHPRGPNEIEVHVWTFVNKSAPEDIKERWRKGSMLTFSPSGVFEMDDGENWEYSTRTNEGYITRQHDLYIGLGMNTQILNSEMPGNVFQGQVNEANQRAFYQRWLDLMQSASWADVPRRDVPKERV